MKQDEADAAAREAAAEQQSLEADAQRRIRILRGEDIPAPPSTPNIEQDGQARQRDTSGARLKKRKRIHGENDTDRDIRYAQEDQQWAAERAEKEAKKALETTDVSLTDKQGHINLFPSEPQKKQSDQVSKNPEAESERSRKQKELEDQYTMRFSNAAGFRQSVQEKPWYSSTRNIGEEMIGSDIPSKDVWGDADPGRREREKSRMAVDDPLVAMKQGAAAARQMGKQRAEWKAERQHELQGLERAERRRERHRRRNRRDGEIKEFRLDDDERELELSHYQRHHRRKDEKHRSWNHQHHQHAEHQERSKSTHRSRDRRKDSCSHRGHERVSRVEVPAFRLTL